MCVGVRQQFANLLKRGALSLFRFKNGNFVREQVENEAVDVELLPFLVLETGKKL